MSLNPSDRYQRQVLLPNFGKEGQERLYKAKVLVVGAGGLGCPVLQYLTAAGIGHLGIVDDDAVSITNLHRQILFGSNDLGKNKAVRAAEVLRNQNNEVEIISYPTHLKNDNALDLISEYDLVIDGTDNFASRYLINDACFLLNKPLVFAAISQFEGQVAIFNLRDERGEKSNYRDLFPEPPAAGEVLNCAEAGVIGVLPGIIGTMQAMEAIKLIAKIGNPLINRMFTYNALTNQGYEMEISSTTYNGPADRNEFLSTDYEWLCGTVNSVEITADQLKSLLTGNKTMVIDVREAGEQPSINDFQTINIPLQQLEQQPALAIKNHDENIVVVCQTGVRSRKAANLLKSLYSNRTIYSLKGGVISWNQNQNQL